MQNSANSKGIWSSLGNPPEFSDVPNLWERLKEDVDFASSTPQRVECIIEQKLESSREGEYYIIKNPHAGTYLKLSDRDFYLWSLMDGSRSVKDLVIEYFANYNSFAFARIGSLVNQLRDNHFLTDQPFNTFGNLKKELDKGTFRSRSDRLWQSFLNKDFSLYNIDRFVSIIYKAFGWILFTAPVKYLCLLLSCVGPFFFVGDLNRETYPILQAWHGHNHGMGFLSILVIYVLIIAIHEMSHALAVKYYGRNIRKGGFLIYFGIPAFFVDTMDIWMEPRKHRIVVSSAGPYSQLVSGGLAAIIAAIIPGTFVGSLLFKFSFFSYLSVLINLNPLLEMDGYFILMDWLEIPLLRRRSLNFVKRELWPKIRNREKFSKDERIFTVFGVLVGIWSICAILFAIYLWEQRIITEERRLLYKIAIVFLLGVPLLTILVMKLGSVLYSSLSWLANNKYLKNNSNLMALLVGLSIGIGVILYFEPFARVQICRDILKLLILALALFFAIKDVICYREGHLKRTFQFLTGFISLLFLAESISLLSFRNGMDYSVFGPFGDSPSLINSLAIARSVLRIGAYSLLLLSMSMLAIKDIKLCRQGERSAMLASLILSCSLILIAVVQGLRGENSLVDILHMMDFLFPVGLVSLAFVLLIPSCFVYQKTDFLLAWLVLAASLVGMSTANILLYAEAEFEAATFYILGYALLTSALFSHYVIYMRFRFTRVPEVRESAIRYDDKRRLRSAFANMFEAIFVQLMFIYGKRVTLYVQEKLNRRSHEAGWRLKAVYQEIEDDVPENFSIISISEVYRGFLSRTLDLISDVTGRIFVEKAMQRATDRLYWDEREVAYEHLLSPLERGKKLTEEFRMAKEDLLKALQGMAIFSGLSQQELLLISSRLHTEKLREGTVLVRQGDLGDRLYIIKSGHVEVAVREDSSSSERVVAHLSEGDYFGEIALLGNVPRTATCRASTSLEVWVLSKRDFNLLVKKSLDLPQRLDRAIGNMTMLLRMPLFRELTYKQINMISSMLKTRTVAPQTVIIKEGELGDAFYIIRSGEVMVTARTESGEKTVARLGEAEYFGEIALVTDQLRTATVTSVSETELLIIEKADFDAVMELISSDLEQAGSRRLLDTRRKLQSVSVDETPSQVSSEPTNGGQ